MSKLTKDRNPWPVSVTGSNLVAAGRATAGTTDAAIETAGFNRVVILNESTDTELVLAVDEASTGTPAAPIYVPAGASYAEDISGADLHYSVALGTASFLYTLR